MSGNNKKKNVEIERLEKLEGLVDRYAQSRSMGLWVGAVLVLINTIVLVGSIELAKFLLLADKSWSSVPIVFALLWVPISTIWLIWFEKKHNYSFYNKRDGQIEVEKEPVPAWAWIAYLITFLGPLILNMCNILSTRWALTIALASFGLFVIYIGKKQKDTISSAVCGGLCLITAAATAVGIPTILAGKNWIYSYFLTLNIYVVGAILVTMVVVHIYNRRILRKIKRMGPVDGQ